MGAARAVAACNADSSSPDCANQDQILRYTTSLASFRINDSLVDFMKNWMTDPIDNTTSPYSGGHRNNTDYGEIQGFTGTWVTKVVKCSDIPDTSLNNYVVDATLMNDNVLLW